MLLRSVLLPLPFGPTITVISSGFAVIQASERMCSVPYPALRFLTWSKALIAEVGLNHQWIVDHFLRGSF